MILRSCGLDSAPAGSVTGVVTSVCAGSVGLVSVVAGSGAPGLVAGSGAPGLVAESGVAGGVAGSGAPGGVAGAFEATDAVVAPCKPGSAPSGAETLC